MPTFPMSGNGGRCAIGRLERLAPSASPPPPLPPFLKDGSPAPLAPPPQRRIPAPHPAPARVGWICRRRSCPPRHRTPSTRWPNRGPGPAGPGIDGSPARPCRAGRRTDGTRRVGKASRRRPERQHNVIRQQAEVGPPSGIGAAAPDGRDGTGGGVRVEAHRASGADEFDSRQTHRRTPWRENLVANVSAAPANVKRGLVLEDEEVGHAEGGGGRALLARGEEPRQDHRLKRLVVQPLAHAQLLAQVAEGDLVVLQTSLLRIVKLGKGGEQPGRGGQSALIAVHGPDCLQPSRRVLALLGVAGERVVGDSQLVEQAKDVQVLVPEAVLARLGPPAAGCQEVVRDQAADAGRGVHHSDLDTRLLAEGVRGREAAPAAADHHNSLGVHCRHEAQQSDVDGHFRESTSILRTHPPDPSKTEEPRCRQRPIRIGNAESVAHGAPLEGVVQSVKTADNVSAAPRPHSLAAPPHIEPGRGFWQRCDKWTGRVGCRAKCTQLSDG
eukprot:scaffold4064_cov117-Isochrysis_galbana.AAC.3